jgi:hypothetical protein
MTRIWKIPVLVLATAYFVVDGLSSYVTRPVAVWMSHMRILERTRRWIVSLRPYPSLALFAVPVIILEHGRTVRARLDFHRMELTADRDQRPASILALICK